MDLNDAAGRVAAEQGSLRTFEDVDARQRVKRKNGRIAAHDIKIIEIDGDRALLAGSVRIRTDTANEGGGRVDFVSHLDAGNQFGKLIGANGSRSGGSGPG